MNLKAKWWTIVKVGEELCTHIKKYSKYIVKMQKKSGHFFCENIQIKGGNKNIY